MIIVVIYIIEYISEKPLESFCQFFSQVLSEVLNMHIKKKNLWSNHRICGLVCFIFCGGGSVLCFLLGLLL